MKKLSFIFIVAFLFSETTLGQIKVTSQGWVQVDYTSGGQALTLGDLGPLDSYGNCMPISSPFPYSQHLITTNETWQNSYSECANVIVKNGGNLTITGATINLEGNATFSTEIGSTLTFNSGTIQ